MSFKATLNLGDKKYRLKTVHFDFEQPHDYKSAQPTGEVLSGNIHVTTIVTKDPTLLEWMVERGMEKDGSIVYYNKKDDSAWRTIEFKKGHLVSYSESFSDGGEVICDLTIISPELKVGDKISWIAPFKDMFDEG